MNAMRVGVYEDGDLWWFRCPYDFERDGPFSDLEKAAWKMAEHGWTTHRRHESIWMEASAWSGVKCGCGWREEAQNRALGEMAFKEHEAKFPVSSQMVTLESMPFTPPLQMMREDVVVFDPETLFLTVWRTAGPGRVLVEKRVFSGGVWVQEEP